jgi:hypothetical protein
VRCWCASGAVWAALSDVRASADMSYPGFVLVEMGVRVSGITCCHPMSLAVYVRRGCPDCGTDRRDLQVGQAKGDAPGVIWARRCCRAAPVSRAITRTWRVAGKEPRDDGDSDPPITLDGC